MKRPPIDREALEALIDTHGLPNFLFAISEICTEKAEHLVTNWNAHHSASVWNTVSNRIEKIAALAKQEGIL